MEILFRAEMKFNKGKVQGTYHYSADLKRHYILRRERFMLEKDYCWIHRAEIKVIEPKTLEMKDCNGNWILVSQIKVIEKL